MIAFPPSLKTVAVAGDWHGDKQFACWAIMAASSPSTGRADFLLHTGDFGYDFRPDYLDALDRTAAYAGLIVAFVDGNHEDFDWLLSQPVDPDGVRRLRDRVWHLPRGFRWAWTSSASPDADPVSFLALGGAVSPDRDWRMMKQNADPAQRCWWPQEQITEADAERAVSGGPVDVMICHDVPAGVPDTVLGIDGNPFGFEPETLAECDRQRVLLRRVVEAVQPRRLWHGHYHRRYSFELETLTGNRCTVEGFGANNGIIENNMTMSDIASL